MSTCTANDVRATVIALIRDAVEAKLGERRPDLIVGFDVTRSTREVFGWERVYDAAVAESAPSAEVEHEALCAEWETSVRSAVAKELSDLRRTGLRRLRIALSNRYLPADLRKWAHRQFERAVKKRNPWAVAYVVLILRDVVEWESIHDPLESEERKALDEALVQEQAAWVRRNTMAEDAYDGSPSLKSLAGKDEPAESTL